MSKLTVKLIIDPQNNSITFSKNFRIFSTQEPITGIIEFAEFLEDLITSSPDSVDLTYLKRSIRYSRNKLDWSLWYEVAPGNLGDAASIFLDKADPFYFEVKYEYDDGTKNEISSPIIVNEIKLRFVQGSSIPNTFTPVVTCSDEKCNSIISNTEPSFRPYEVGSAIGMYQELSYFTNQIYGHQVVYFRTLPESDSGDYVFKEWTLYKNVDRKCIKVMVPKNAFPSNAPKYTEFGLDFQLPFEIHLDHRYFQSIFGSGSEPRKRDFLYFPLINRMFEIQGSYLHRGFMMTPTFWKIQLKKFTPNIDMLLKDESRTFLDNVIVNAEQLFGEEVKDDIKDGTMPQQYKTISTTFDSSRRAIHPDLVYKPLKYTFNFASLIENYYDMGTVLPSELSYQITNETPPLSTSIKLENLPSINDRIVQSNDVILAYQDSGPFAAWKNGGLSTNDRNVGGGSTLSTRIRGPFDFIPNHEGQSIPGRYIRIESYRDLSFKDQRNVLIETVGANKFVKFKTRQTGVIYNANPVFNTTSEKNLSFTCLFNVPSTSTTINFIDGFDPLSASGVKISGQFNRYFNSQPEGDLSITLELNSQVKNYTIANFKSSEWHGLVISISNEFKQCGVYVYSIKEDPADLINHTDFNRIFSNISSITATEFSLEQHYSLPASPLWIANLRLFNTMLKEEQHDFILSQQFVKDESLLILIDNCRPQLNLPYIAKNR
jgi:hypothetical protein